MALTRDNPDGPPLFVNGIVRFYAENNREMYIGVWGNGYITECQKIDPIVQNYCSNELYYKNKTNPWCNSKIDIYLEKLNDDCPICLDPLLDIRNCRKLNGCSHVFHMYCIDKWKRIANSCPMCRNT